MKNIESLEREIEIFKQNIANSNQLISDLQSTVNALKEHNSNIDNLTAEFSNNVPQKILDISSAAYQKSNSELNAVFDAKISELIRLQETVKANVAELELFAKNISNVIIQTNNNISNSIREEISAELKEYPYNNRQYIDNLISCLKDTEIKIEQLSEKISTVNNDVLEKILVLCEDKSVEHQMQKMNDNLKNKFIPVYLGMAAMIILFIIQFFI